MNFLAYVVRPFMAAFWLAAGILLVPVDSLARGSFPTQAQTDAMQSAPQETARDIVYSSLPAQAQHTYTLILRGGPFDYQQDGTVFGNYEGHLPAQARGYYREYTVETPGISHRGVRRIVCGGNVKTAPQVCYYSADHYNSFRRIVEIPPGP